MLIIWDLLSDIMFRLFTKSAFLLALLLLTACSGKDTNNSERVMTSDTLSSDSVQIDNYDIAMAVSSITDAIDMGEPLDTAEYNFEGILTDGQGTPLYTDIQGAPGVWRIAVVGEKRAKIQNVYLGDLVPDSLRTYIVSTLAETSGIKPECLYTDNDDNGCLGYYPTISYNLGKSLIIFETKSVTTADGEEGPLFSIIISARQGRNT